MDTGAGADRVQSVVRRVFAKDSCFIWVVLKKYIDCIENVKLNYLKV